MGDKWKEYRIGEIAEVIMGQSPPGHTYNEQGNGLPFFQGAKDFGNRYPTRRVFCSEPTRIAERGDVLISVRAPIGRINRAIEKCAIGRGVAAIRGKTNADTIFIEYLLKFYGKNWDAYESEGSVFGNLRKEDLLNLKFKCPPEKERAAIASILGALDDKIELNRKMNETLEAMARAIFKSCFSYLFDGLKYLQAETPSPDLTGHPLPLGEGRGEGELELVDSPLGKIPKGWRVGTLSELCEKPQYGFTASAKETPIGKKFLRITDINKQAWIDWTSVPYCEITPEQFEQYRVKTGDILIARMADPGHGVLIEEDADAVFASYLIRFRPIKLEYSRYLQYWLRSPEYWDLVHARSAGTTRASLNAQILGAFQLVIPTEDVAITFQNAIDIIRSKVNSNVKESNTLASIRDALLPKLLSGEIRVKDAERFVEKRT